MCRLADNQRTMMQLARANPTDATAKSELTTAAETLAAAADIAALNTDLAPGTAGQLEVNVPQKNWPALVAFGVLTLLLAVVGMGWLMKGAAG